MWWHQDFLEGSKELLIAIESGNPKKRKESSVPEVRTLAFNLTPPCPSEPISLQQHPSVFDMVHERLNCRYRAARSRGNKIVEKNLKSGAIAAIVV
jgi:hypothetical protein